MNWPTTWTGWAGLIGMVAALPLILYFLLVIVAFAWQTLVLIAEFVLWLNRKIGPYLDRWTR